MDILFAWQRYASLFAEFCELLQSDQPRKLRQSD